MLERLAHWYLRKQIIDWKIQASAAWNEGYQMGFRMGFKAGVQNKANG